jgi:hypothetical protein
MDKVPQIHFLQGVPKVCWVTLCVGHYLIDVTSIWLTEASTTLFTFYSHTDASGIWEAREYGLLWLA